MSDFEEKYDYQEIMVEDISQIYQIANDYNSFYDLPRSGRGDPGDERTYLQAFIEDKVILLGKSLQVYAEIHLWMRVYRNMEIYYLK